MVAVVPTTINFKMHDGASATLRNSVIAISTNGGSIFYFLEGGDQGKEFLKENYPKLLEMVSIPIAELSVESGGKVTRLELRNGNWVAKQEPLTQAVANNVDQPRQETTGRESETRKVGTITYKVIRSWWQDKLSSNELLEERPDANFLLVQLIVRNDDKEARTIPPFKLVDETGGEHETTDKAYAFDGSIGELESLNPGVQKEGIVIFDCLKTHRYSLKVSGGFWSAEDGLIALTPQNDQHITESGEVSEKRPIQDNLELTGHKPVLLADIKELSGLWVSDINQVPMTIDFTSANKTITFGGEAAASCYIKIKDFKKETGKVYVEWLVSDEYGDITSNNGILQLTTTNLGHKSLVFFYEENSESYTFKSDKIDVEATLNWQYESTDNE